MADEIVLRVSSMRITAEEECSVALDDVPVDEIAKDLNLALVGKLLSVRTHNFEAMKRTLNQIWSLSKDALFRAIENGYFVVQFANARDKSKVLAGRPWTFDNHLVMLNEINGDQQPSDILMTLCPFWIRLYNLPLGCRSMKHIRLVAGSVREVIDVESDGVVWDSSARARVMVDVTKPLKRVQKISTTKGPAFVELKYECLPTFCYVCGRIGHIVRDCLDVDDEERGTEKQWGSWIRASPRRGRQKMEDEAKKFLSCARNICFESPCRELKLGSTPKDGFSQQGEETPGDVTVEKVRDSLPNHPSLLAFESLSEHQGISTHPVSPPIAFTFVSSNYGASGMAQKIIKKGKVIKGGGQEKKLSPSVGREDNLVIGYAMFQGEAVKAMSRSLGAVEVTSVGVQECAREDGEGQQKCESELGGVQLVDEGVMEDSGRGVLGLGDGKVEAGIRKEGLPPVSGCGLGGESMRRYKKVSRKGAKGEGCLDLKKGSVARGEKRKESMVEEWPDGFDVVCMRQISLASI